MRQTNDITVVLVGPESDGNIGAVARAMKNFGIVNLVLVKPAAPLEYNTIKPYSMHGYDVYLGARIVDSPDFLKGFDISIAFTGKSDPNSKILRQPIPLKRLTSYIKPKTALVFGRESSGLTNDEIGMCDVVSTIPANLEYPTLNLSHAVTVVLYELFGKKFETSPDLVSAATKNTLIGAYEMLADTESFKNPDVVKLAFRKMVAKSDLTEKEAKAVLALFSKIAKGRVP